jgi:hypothetical protein
MKIDRPLQEVAGVLLPIRPRQPAGTGVGPWAVVGGSQTRRPGHSKGRIRLAARHALLSQLGNGLWEVRSDLTDGKIARVIFCVARERMVLLHGFVKKTQKTPAQDLGLARNRMKEVP